MSETTTQMQDFLTRQAKVCHDNCEIEKDLYKELGVKRGLRDVDGVGVLAGLTNISCIQSSEMINGDRKSTRLNSSHNVASRMPSSA